MLLVVQKEVLKSNMYDHRYCRLPLADELLRMVLLKKKASESLEVRENVTASTCERYSHGMVGKGKILDSDKYGAWIIVIVILE